MFNEIPWWAHSCFRYSCWLTPTPTASHPRPRCSRPPHMGVGGRVSGRMVDVLTCLRELSHLTQLVTGVKRQRVQGAFERGSRSFWHVIHKSLQFRVIRLPKETTQRVSGQCALKKSTTISPATSSIPSEPCPFSPAIIVHSQLTITRLLTPTYKPPTP